MLQLLLITAMLGNVTIKNTLKHACMYMKHVLYTSHDNVKVNEQMLTSDIISVWLDNKRVKYHFKVA